MLKLSAAFPNSKYPLITGTLPAIMSAFNVAFVSAIIGGRVITSGATATVDVDTESRVVARVVALKMLPLTVP